MTKIQQWLAHRFLPALLYRDLTSENEILRSALAHERSKTQELRAYIKGVNAALRHCSTVQSTYQAEEATLEQHRNGVFRRNKKA